MIVAGVMSGTSADGIDVAICRITPGDRAPRVKVLGHTATRYPARLRTAVLAAMDARSTTTAELARLNWRLGDSYATAVESAAQQLGLKPQLIACHGQTLYHQSTAVRYVGAAVRCTWQTGEASVIAERLGVPVVSDFRSADLAAGGQGAPLVPMFDYCMFRDARKSRVLLNLGGIANVTVLPAGCRAEDVLAFDTGPANMVIDACMERLFGRSFDADGTLAARGNVLESVLRKLLRARYFSAPPPKSCGREQYGVEFVNAFIRACERESRHKQDVIATATALTARSIADAYGRFCKPRLESLAPESKVDLIAAGGGVRNDTLMTMLRRDLQPMGVRVRSIEEAGLNPAAKEAAAFALLGWMTWHRLPGNLPSATGAKRPVILGKVTLA